MILVLCFAFVGCDNGDGGDISNGGDIGGNGSGSEVEDGRLAVPQNVTVSDTGLITWSAVENAEYYIVVLNGNNYKSTTTSYQVGSVVNDFTYAVMAAGNGYKTSKASETKTFTGKGVPVDPILDSLKVSITGNQNIGSGKSTQLTATVKYPDGVTSSEITWQIVDGSEYGTIDEKGKFTANQVTEDHEVTIRAISKENPEKYADIIIGVMCKPALTNEMLDEVKDNYIGFEGYMDIDLYTFGITERYVETVKIYGISTQMNGERWHASYIDANGYTNTIDYRKIDGDAQQVALSLLNDEEYYPMTDEAGNTVRWENSGLYNQFPKLEISDFVFDEDDWRYYYSGADKNILQMMITSANPYDFEADRFGLIIEDGEFLGIYAESKPSYTVLAGYKAFEKLYSYINCGKDNVTVPEITKFAHNPATSGGGKIDHDMLGEAIENMQSLKSYKMKLTISNHMAAGYSLSGYYETVIDGEYFFEPFTTNTATYIESLTKDAQYGYHKIDDGLYNSYNYFPDVDKYVAARAYKGDMTNAKASFAFAPEIFTAWAPMKWNKNDAYLFMADESMCHVASTLYFGVGNDMPLYGLFAMVYPMLWDYPPCVIVQDGYIVEAEFFYFLGDMYGSIAIEYSDFDTAEMPETYRPDLIESFVPRTPPTSWAELSVIVDTIKDEEVNAVEYFAGLFGSEDDVNNLPFFNDLLGDTFGFALVSRRAPGARPTLYVETVILYYDIPLEADRTIDGTIKRAQEFLVQNGFTKNRYGEYEKGNVSAMPYDSSLDFWIYVWKTVK